MDQVTLPAYQARETRGVRSRRGAAQAWETFRLVLRQGGPGFCQFAINNACNANCGFCGFARDRLPKHQWEYVERDGALRAIHILHRQGVRYLVLTGGEPTLHPDHVEIVAEAGRLGMKVMMVTNGGLLKPHRIRRLAEAGLSSFIISIDAATAEAHEDNRGLPGVCARIAQANAEMARYGLTSTASVTMSRLVDYDRLPDFLQSLGFRSVTFSYPLTHLGSNFLGYQESEVVDYTRDELLVLFDRVKAFKKRFHVVNPTASLEEMQRFLRGEQQKFPCLGGYRFFYLDWKLMMWRCHYWDEPMGSVFDFDESMLVRDGCTKCMIDCYRDASVMQHVAVSVHDAAQAVQSGHIGQAARALASASNLGSLRAVFEELPWILRM